MQFNAKQSSTTKLQLSSVTFMSPVSPVFHTVVTVIIQIHFILPIRQIILWRLFTHLIWLTLFTACSVTNRCHRIPIWKLYQDIISFYLAFRTIFFQAFLIQPSFFEEKFCIPWICTWTWHRLDWLNLFGPVPHCKLYA